MTFSRQMKNGWSIYGSCLVAGKLKYIRSLALIFLFAFNSPTTAYAQDCLTEDHPRCMRAYISSTVVTVGVFSFAMVGLIAITGNADKKTNKSSEFSESDIIEARDQLLEYRASGEANLKDYELAYRYPMLSKYIDNLRRSKQYESSSTNELMEVAAEIFKIKISSP